MRVSPEEHRLVAALSPADRAVVLGAGAVVRIGAGATLLRQGEAAGALDLLLEGTVRVVRHEDGVAHELAVLGADSWVGEQAVLTGGEATADVVTLSDCRVLRIPADRREELLGLDGLRATLDRYGRRRRATHRALTLPPLPVGDVDGAPLGLRPMWPDDWWQLHEGTDRVSERSLRQRFFTIPPLTERTFRRLADVDWSDQFAWALLLDGELVGVGRHALLAEDRDVAEVALLIADDLQGQGLGRRLMAAVAASAAAHGASSLEALARADNHGVQHLLAGFGAVWDTPTDGVVRSRWPLSDALDQPDLAGLVSAARDIAATVLHDVTQD